MALESGIQARIIKAVKKRGGWVLNTHGTVFGRNGVPDLIVCLRGHFIAMEVKQPGGEARPLQRYELRKIREAGGKAFVVESVADAERAMDEVLGV